MAKVLIQQIDQFDNKEIIASGSSHKEALDNLIIAINDDAVDTENCSLEVILHPVNGKVNSRFKDEVHYLYMNRVLIDTFTEYQVMSDYCVEHGLTLVKSTGL